MKKILLLASLLLTVTSCDKKEEEEDLSDLKRMVQAPSSPTETPSESIKR